MKQQLPLLVLVLFSTVWIYAQSHAFTYQGRVNESGTPYTGSAEFKPTFRDA